MIKRISCDRINSNIIKIKEYTRTGVYIVLNIYGTDYKSPILCESNSKSWIHDTIYNKTGMEYNE